MTWFRRILALLVCGAIVGSAGRIESMAVLNWRHLSAAKCWTDVKYTGPRSEFLEDGVPDGWEPELWGGATGVVMSEAGESVEGSHSVGVTWTNKKGGAALGQRLAVDRASRLYVRAWAKGNGGAVVVLGRDSAQAPWRERGRIAMGPSERWVMSGGAIECRPVCRDTLVFLESDGREVFDNVFLGERDVDDGGDNLLNNAGFERDGWHEDPVEWWSTHTTGGERCQIVDWSSFPRQSVWAHVGATIGHRFAMVRRAAAEEKNCASNPSLTSWLISRGAEFELKGGPAAREKIYQLAIDLAPSCPQGYEALASLHGSHLAFSSAAALHLKAAKLAGGSPSAGSESFAAGSIYLKNTGQLEAAVLALTAAEQVTGWESTPWYGGAATFEKGEALQGLGLEAEAEAAFRRVLDRGSDAWWHESARRQLKQLAERGDR